MDLSQRLAGRVAVITGGGSGIGLAAGRRMRAEGATIVVGDVDVEAGGAAADELSGLFVPTDVCDEDAVNGLFDGAAETYGRIDIAFNNAGISPPEDNLIENRARGVATGTRRQPEVGVLVLPGGPAPHGACWERLHRQHGVLRCGDGFGNVADLLHRLQGWSAGYVTGTGRAIRSAGHPGQRVVPGAGEHPTAARAFRQEPGTGRSPHGACAAGPVRRARRNCCCGSVFSQRRRIIHHRFDVPGRRWDQLGLCHSAVIAPRV